MSQGPLKPEFETTPPLLTHVPLHRSSRRHGESSAATTHPKPESSTPHAPSQQSSASTTASNHATDSAFSGQNVFDLGIGFIHTLVQKTLQNLSLQYPGLLARPPSNVIEDLFNKSAPTSIDIRQLSTELPSYDQTRRLTRTAMDYIYPLSSIVPDAQLTGILEKIRSTAVGSFSRQQSDDAVLLRMIVSLGYLCNANVHLEAGCHHARTERCVHVCLALLEADHTQYQTFHACPCGHW